MSASPLLSGLLLGALGAACHLLLLGWRVQSLLRGRPGRARLARPLGLLAPAAAVLAAASLATDATWAALLGLVLARWLLLARLARAA